ncbi:hypothetical protein K523DRAFT_358954 [Schizophyllum commune Tattone D]|nr:hypothetical protein K523DRAFT_358954 [Schizophyllum commune Tattone D]
MIRLNTVAHDGQRQQPRVIAILQPYKKEHSLVDLFLSGGIYELSCVGANEAWASGYYSGEPGISLTHEKLKLG